MAPENLSIQRDGAVVTLTIDRPKVLNSLDPATLQELDEVLPELAADPDMRVLILTGAGDRAFVAGADIAAMRDMGPLEAESHAARGMRVCSHLESMDAVTIAAVDGYALGGGLELALACDLRVASEGSQLGLPETSLSVVPGFGGTQRLPRLVGEGRAKELILTASRIPAEEAFTMGLVNRVVPKGEALQAAREMAEAILGNGPVAVRLAKHLIHDGLQTDLDRGLALERKAFGLVFSTEDQTEGMTAFLEKRKPAWRGA